MRFLLEKTQQLTVNFAQVSTRLQELASGMQKVAFHDFKGEAASKFFAASRDLTFGKNFFHLFPTKNNYQEIMRREI